MSIVKLQSPIVVEGGGEKGNSTGILIFGIIALAAAYFGWQYFQNKKKKEGLQTTH